MIPIETSLHLFQSPRYRGEDGTWHATIEEAVLHSGKQLTWDLAGILSVVAFGYACGNQTLIKEISRQPWLSEICPDGSIREEPIPPHDTLWMSIPQIARKMIQLLSDEAIRACQGRNEIYLLLSGGMDSRVVGSVFSALAKQGKLPAKPVALTWGAEQSRDVVYAQEISRILGFEWGHIDLTPDVLQRNVFECGKWIACLNPPTYIHAYSWFENISPNAIVIGSSYGDSIGRAEFSGRHLLELELLNPTNRFGLLRPDVYAWANHLLKTELQRLYERSGNVPKYVLCEHEMQAHYTRGMLGHAMSMINRYCTLYQMFTDPTVYTYIWSLHPALRFDEIYAEILDQLNPALARIPWARTNRAIRGATEEVKTGLQVRFQSYREWIGGPLFDPLLGQIDLEWIEATGIFQVDAVRKFCYAIRENPGDFKPYTMAWLASFRELARWLGQLGVSLQKENIPSLNQPVIQRMNSPSLAVRLRARASEIKPLRGWVKRTRRYFLKRKYLREYPPVKAVSGPVE